MENTPQYLEEYIMATIKEIAEIVGVSNAAVSRVLNYDEGISVSPETRSAIFAAAEKIGYKKRVIYPKIENVALLYYVQQEDELEDAFYQSIRNEILKQAKKMNIHLRVYTREDGIETIPADLNAFVGVGWMGRKEFNKLYRICKRGVFIGSSPDEKLFDVVRPNMDSFVTQIVDYFVKKGHKSIGFIGGPDWNVDTGKPVMDVREWSFRQSAMYYKCLDERCIFIADKYTVEEGYRMGKKLSQMQEPPTAVCVASDTLAVGVLQAVNEAGIQIPEQLAVFSINDMDIAKYVSPPLTTIHIDIPTICETALDILSRRVLNGSKITKSVFVNGLPVFRKSC